MRYLIILLLTGCTSIPQDGAITIKWHRNPEVWREVSKHFKLTKSDFWDMTGYTFIENGVCHVFAPDPPMKEVAGKKTYTHDQWAILGHEVKHCFDGEFHKGAIKK